MQLFAESRQLLRRRQGRAVAEPDPHAEGGGADVGNQLRGLLFVKGDAEGLVNMPLQIKGHKLSISLREDSDKPNLVWVSLRSVDDFPCNKMAEEFFNGGGHLNASGGRVNGTMQDAVETVKKAFRAYENKLK